MDQLHVHLGLNMHKVDRSCQSDGKSDMSDGKKSLRSDGVKSDRRGYKK